MGAAEDWFGPADVAAMDALRRAEEAARAAETARQAAEAAKAAAR